jgi:hypothetical protein
MCVWLQQPVAFDMDFAARVFLFWEGNLAGKPCVSCHKRKYQHIFSNNSEPQFKPTPSRVFKPSQQNPSRCRPLLPPHTAALRKRCPPRPAHASHACHQARAAVERRKATEGNGRTQQRQDAGGGVRDVRGENGVK